MIIENSGIKGAKSELSYLDNVMDSAEFVRWQWEYTRATYDCQIHDKKNNETYYLRVNAKVNEGKLENPQAVLEIGESYIGRATYPHGLDYSSPIPDGILNTAKQKLSQLKQKLV